MVEKVERGRDDGRRERDRLGAVIWKRIIDGLGEPAGLRQVQVHRLWEDHYRVNVLVGADAASAKVAHSYFLVADGAGHIIASSPEITKQY